MMRGTVALFVLVWVLAGCASLKQGGPYFFIQMADTQFGFFNENLDFKKELLHFEKAIAEANRLRPAFVIVCGDLVNKVGDPDQVAAYKQVAAKLDASIKLYNVAGNHDVENIPTETSLANYRRDFGRDYYRFKAGRIVGIVLNSSLMRNPDSARAEAAEQDRWLKSTLDKVANSRGKMAVVFQHHPLFLNKPDEPDQYFNFPLETRERYLALFKDSGVKYVFAGHYHRNASGRSGDLEMVTTGPVGRPLGQDPSGFRIVILRGDDLQHRYYSLDSIPKAP